MVNKFPRQENMQIHSTNKAVIKKEESRLFNDIIEKMFNRKKTLLTYKFNEIDYINEFKQSSKRKYELSIIKTMNKLLDFKLSLVTAKENIFESTAIISGYKIYYKNNNGYIDIKLTTEAQHSITKFYEGQFNLERYSKLKSTYSKRALQLFEEQISNKGNHKIRYILNTENFNKLFDVPLSYSQSDIDKNVLNKIKKELSPFFLNLNITKMYSNESGNPVTDYVFKWDKKETT